MNKNKDSMNFAYRLRKLRETAGISIYALAQRSGLTRQYLGALERGLKEPSLDTARRLAAALGKSLDVWS